MALQSVVNRCTNSAQRLAHLFVSVKVLGLRILYMAKRFCGAFAVSRGKCGGQLAGEAAGVVWMVIDSIMAGSSGTPSCGSLTGSAPIASTTSVPALTLPKMV